MKNLLGIICLTFALAVLIPLSFATDSLIGVVAPLSKERIAALTGDKALLNLGEKEGLTKGDIGSIALDKIQASDNVIGQCAVTKTRYQTSVCEIVKAKREVEAGNSVFFDPVRYTDATFFPFAIRTLSTVVDPYEPHKRLTVCVYGVFDENNAVSAFSDEIATELRRIFAQKKRIKLVNKQFLNNLVFYPDSDEKVIDFVKDAMKKSSVHALIMGKYSLSGNKINIMIRNVDANGHDATMQFSLPLEPRYRTALSTVVLPPREPSTIERSIINVVVKSTTYQPLKDEKPHLITREAAGNPFVEQSMKRTEFNLISPVDVKVRVDNEVLTPAPDQKYPISLSKGVHRLVASFKRGDFFNESLLHTSQEEITKEALLDLSKQNETVIEVRLNPLFHVEPISLNVYHQATRQRHVIKPIYRVESQKTVEIFKD
jgi:hypothetical protein